MNSRNMIFRIIVYISVLVIISSVSNVSEIPPDESTHSRLPTFCPRNHCRTSISWSENQYQAPQLGWIYTVLRKLVGAGCGTYQHHRFVVLTSYSKRIKFCMLRYSLMWQRLAKVGSAPLSVCVLWVQRLVPPMAMFKEGWLVICLWCAQNSFK